MMNKIADCAVVYGQLETPPIIFESSLLLGTLGDLNIEELMKKIPVKIIYNIYKSYKWRKILLRHAEAETLIKNQF